MADLAGFAGSSEQRYAIDRKIASGGMASVYLARGVGPLGFERPVAIKACHPHLALGEERKQALLDEAKVAARIHHPNVVATLDVVVHAETVVIVMEYVEGLTLAGLLKHSALSAPLALRVIGDALAGLHAAHELKNEQGASAGIVHRDVSPQNILVGVDGHAKLADFGVFKGEDRTAPSTASGDLKGKLGYVAPEVYRGESATRRADVFAMGVVLWESLAGRRLFAQSTHASVMHDTLRGNVPSIATMRDDVPAEIDGVIARALAVDPEERFATAEDLARALEALPVSTASARAVGEHVRAAMPAAPASEIHQLATPGEYVTPVKVRSERVGVSRRLAPIAIAIAAIALVASIAAGFVVRTRDRAASNVAAAAPVVSSAPAVATSAAAPSPSAPATPATETTPSTAQKAAPAKVPSSKPQPRVVKSAPAGSARPAARGPFDPEEI